MTLSENMKKFIEPIFKTCESQFPKKCGNCGREFKSFKDFVSITKGRGAPQYSSEINDPFGLISYANCECGSTLVLSCSDGNMHKIFVSAIESESANTGHKKSEILSAIREEVRARALSSK